MKGLTNRKNFYIYLNCNVSNALALFSHIQEKVSECEIFRGVKRTPLRATCEGHIWMWMVRWTPGQGTTAILTLDGRTCACTTAHVLPYADLKVLVSFWVFDQIMVCKSEQQVDWCGLVSHGLMEFSTITLFSSALRSFLFPFIFSLPPDVSFSHPFCVLSSLPLIRLYVANVGDSRAVLCLWIGSTGTLQCDQISDDHNVYNPLEQSRLENLGLNVQKLVEWGRLGPYANTRSIGDYSIKGGYKDVDILRWKIA